MNNGKFFTKSMDMKNDIGKYVANWYIYFLILGISVIYVYFASSSTSPFYLEYWGDDSSMYQTIGKAWTLGKIPYINLFDHKGPYVFFVNMLGYKITGNSIGVMFLQMLNMFVFLIGIYKISQLVDKKSNMHSVWVIAITLAVLKLSYNYGNTNEEYCLPFICFSSYLQIGYLLRLNRDRKIKKHHEWSAFFYGVSFAVCILTRITNGVTICAGVLLISILLFKNKQYRNLFNNALSFCVGTLGGIAPFAIYFGSKDAFNELWYGTIGFNIAYQTRMESWLINADFNTWGSFFLGDVSFYTIVLTIFLLCNRKQYMLTVYCVVNMVLESYLFFSGRQNWYYTMICVPQFVFLLNEVYLMRNRMWNRILFIAISCCAIAVGGISIYSLSAKHDLYCSGIEADYQELLDMIPKKERDSFMVYGGYPQSNQIYLAHNLLPCKKYFILQEWMASFSEAMKRDIHNEFATDEVLWILAEGSVENIQDILNDDYEIIGTVDNYRLYHLLRP